METNFTIPRVTALLLLLAAFWGLGGFAAPEVPYNSSLSPQRVQKAWIYCVLLYLTGAWSATLVDHYVGNLDRSNLRFGYILLGVVAMAGSVLWLRHLKESMETSRVSAATNGVLSGFQRYRCDFEFTRI